MQARYYDPNAGRFLSVDPVGFLETREPKQFNHYAYTWNEPVNATDPTGMVVILTGEEDERAKFIEKASSLTGLVLFEKDSHLNRKAVGEYKRGSAASSLLNAINSSDTIFINAVSNDPAVFGDSFKTKNVDTADLAALEDIKAGLGGAILAHIIEERMYIVRNAGPVVSSEDYNAGHGAGKRLKVILWEVNGA